MTPLLHTEEPPTPFPVQCGWNKARGRDKLLLPAMTQLKALLQVHLYLYEAQGLLFLPQQVLRIL